ncbi:hypothetical protein pipiens_004855 [Culex pipiens pipiens]|uniref:RING-type domain-containing protein n=2 Tax=Culex pipiens TaxID=7175 RepID=A0ABD1CE55_CULPP
MVLLPAAKKSEMAGEGTNKVVAKKATVVNGPVSPYKPSKIHLSSVNPYITCNLCKGYLIDATTIVECLHSFCHSCIMKHLRTEQYCPQCEMMINKAKPNIKPDATLQAIVYKLVPGLYEKELLRKRAFYRQHPDQAALATPEQRGEDTEHLIFGPSEKISLSLEYAEKELADDNEELQRPKCLLCPANFPIASLKKFIIYKYSIPTHLFYVEIMYKVHTITLPDHYTLMDVAYIYTWKKDAHMRFFYRIRTHEMKSVELPEVPLRRSPSLSGAPGPRALATIKEEDGTDCKDSAAVELIKPSDIKRERSVECEGKQQQQQVNSEVNTVVAEEVAPVVPVAPPKADVKPAREVAAEPKVKKNESIKLKIEMTKNTYVSILQSPQLDAASKHHKSDRPEKVKKKKSEDKDRSVNKIKSTSDLKIKIEKVKDGLVSVKKDGKSSKKVPYKVELSPGISDMKNNNLKIALNNEVDSKKAKKEAHKLDKSQKKMKSPKRIPDFDKVQPSIVLKIDQKSPELSTSMLKIVSHPLASSSPKHKPETTIEDEKSQFLNSFELTPIKSVNGGNSSRSPSSSPGSSASPPATSAAEAKTAKRKMKESASGRTVTKKPKLSDDEIKALVERTVQQNIKSTAEQIAPPPAVPSPPVKQEVLSPPAPVVEAPKPNPLPVKTEPTPKEAPKPESKPKPFDFKTPAVLPPPITTTNIPAPKPAQPVMIAPKPSAPESSKRPVPLFPKPIQPAKKLPPLLPKDVDYMKNNNKQKMMEMKQRPTPLTISPNKDTEISQIKPEDAGKNIKVYGPDADNFAVPAALPTIPTKPKSNKSRPVNYLNYALMNNNKVPAGSRTPIPSYSNSPSYSPDSPQYNPNFNISTKQFKYANPLAYANHLQNMLNDRKTVSPPLAAPPQERKPENERKRPCPSPDSKQEPLEKQPKVQSLLNQINIPSSLSITLATEEDEAAREKARKSMPEEDKNYIEILKLPEISITEADRATPPKAVEATSKKVSKSPSPTKGEKSKVEGKKFDAADKTSYQQKYVQSILDMKQRGNKSSSKVEKQPAPVFTPPTSSPSAMNNSFKLPNATVLSNGIVKLNSYPELDLINKNSGGSPGSSSRPTPSPPKPSKHVPIAPKPTGTFFPPTGTPHIPPPQRKSLSPPVPKPLVSPIQPKSKTPPIVHSGSPSHAALAAMGPMFGIQMKPESSGYSKKLQEPRPKKTSQKSPRSSNNNSLLDLSSSPTGPMSAAAAATATTSPSAMDKAKEQAAAMNMLMMNSNAQKQIHMNNYLTELAKLNNQNMMMPQMVGLQPNPVFNQMMQALYLQQYCRMSKASSDNLDK